MYEVRQDLEKLEASNGLRRKDPRLSDQEKWNPKLLQSSEAKC